MQTPTQNDLSLVSTRLDDALMEFSESDLGILEMWSVSEHSANFSSVMATWLADTVAQERRRRRLQVANIKPPPVNEMSNAQIGGFLALSTIWRRSAVSAILECWCEQLHEIALAAAIGRLLDAEDRN